MSNLKCRICENQKNNEVIIAKEMFLGRKDKFDYIFCSTCGSLSIRDIPYNIDDYYKNYYSLDFNTDYSESKLRNFLKRILIETSSAHITHKMCSKILNTQNDFRLKSFSKCSIHKDDPILDIGCGTGDFLKELSFLGYTNLVGADPYLEKDLLYKDKFKIHKKNVFEIEGKYKLIMFHHSLEHMVDLNAVLRRVYDLLDAKGICLIRIPHIDSFSFKRFRGSWFSIHAPFHYVLPSLNGMKSLAQNSSLHIQDRIGEQMYYFFLLSNNHSLGIADYEDLGIRKHFELPRSFRGNPPLYTSAEIRFWKRKAKTLVGTGLEDWISYFLLKK